MSEAQIEQAPVQEVRDTTLASQPLWRRVGHVGAGIGIEIQGDHLIVVAVRVKPTGVSIAGATRIERFRERPAGEWGLEYEQFLKKLGLGYVAAYIVLPRQEVTVRTLSMPGVPAKDLASAISFQADSLHPYGEADIAETHAVVRQDGSVLVAIAEQDRIDHYATLLSEAGVKMAAFTTSVAVMHSAMRLYLVPPTGFVAYDQRGEEVELFGESEARPAFSALFDDVTLRTCDMALSELRLPPDTAMRPLASLLPAPLEQPADVIWQDNALAYAAAMNSAVPRSALDINLLPEPLRANSSRMPYVPTAALATIVLGLYLGHWWQIREADRQYLNTIQLETQRFEPAATRLTRVNRDIDVHKARLQSLDDFRRQAKRDLDAIDELTRILPPPTWVFGLQMNPQETIIGGSTPQADGLLKMLDASPLFEGSEFQQAPSKSGEMEQFSIRSKREVKP